MAGTKTLHDLIDVLCAVRLLEAAFTEAISKAKGWCTLLPP